MRNGIPFHMARLAAVAAMGWTIVPPGSITPAAHAAPPGVAPVEPDPGSSGVPTFLARFWRDVWAAPYVAGSSAMSLRDTGVEGHWTVEAHEGPGAATHRGEYDELARLPVTGLDAALDALIHQFVSVGLIAGSTGYETAVVGLSQTVSLDLPDGPMIVHGFTPLSVHGDAASAHREALEVHDLLSGVEPVAAGDDHFTPDDCLCLDALLARFASCDYTAASCEFTCGAVAAGAIAGCLALGPMAGACIVAVLAALSACLAACLSTLKACRMDALAEYLECLADCGRIDLEPDLRP